MGIKTWAKHELWKNVTQDPQYAEVQMQCDEIVLTEVPQPLYDKLLTEAAQAGVEFKNTTATIDGCTLSWNYDALSATLRVTCTKRPFYVGCHEIEDHIRAIMTKAQQGNL